ncbi:hypothetical protein BKA66DRAFT_475839 [Pyrenochaeta sp. MPI-SDFR-AT-0127]|nr:hypothetical protein BKA66DRAFT_475839 [Pyrenochaeta sp. MPI-SDFR-AT-0127]
MECTTKLNAAYPDYCGSLDGDLCTIQPEPDVAGIGILASFITVGFLVVLPAFYQIWRNEKDAFKWKKLFLPVGWAKGHELNADSSNGRIFHNRQLRVPALSATIFNLADTQFITGIAIAGAMSKKDIVLAHFSIANEMAWLGFISATAGLLTTRFQVLDKGNHAKRLVRIVIMWIYLGLLIHRAREVNDDLSYAEKVHENNTLKPYFRWNFMDSQNHVSLFLLVWSIVGAVVDTVFLWPRLAIAIYYYAARTVTVLYSYAEDSWRKLPNPIAFVCCLAWFCVYVVAWGIYLMFFEPFSCNLASLGLFIWGVTNAFKLRQLDKAV